MTDEPNLDAHEDEGEARSSSGSATGAEEFRRYTQSQVTGVMPQIVTLMIDRTLKGSLGHLRLLLQLSGLEAPLRRKAPSEKDVAKELALQWRADMGLSDSLRDE
jgi:hypothetical protein